MCCTVVAKRLGQENSCMYKILIHKFLSNTFKVGHLLGFFSHCNRIVQRRQALNSLCISLMAVGHVVNPVSYTRDHPVSFLTKSLENCVYVT